MLGGLILLTEERAPYTYALIKELADSLVLPMPVVFLAGNETIFNAFAASFAHSMSCMVLGEDLLKAVNLEEAKSIIAHELGHIKNNHVAKKMLMSISSLAASIFCAVYVGSKCEIRENQISAGYLTFIAAYLLSAPIRTWYSRRCEREADMIAVEVTKNPRAFAHAFEIFKDRTSQFHRDYQYLMHKIDESGLPEKVLKATKTAANWNYRKRKFAEWIGHSWVFASHPSFDERIAYLNAAAEKLELSTQVA